jgi:eukaryotic-like serine/threonine-protein kinase
MNGLFLFLKSKQFFVQLGIVFAVIFILFFGTIKWLSSYTNHGDFVEVPDFKGQKIASLDTFIQNKEISYQIIDSIYDPKEKSGVVLRQDPEANSKVKHNRTVYLSVTGMVAPQIAMPKLIDRSERQARLILVTYGLKVGRIIEKSADCNGCVLSQSIKGKEVTEGEFVKKGSVINLIIGRKDNYFTASAGDTIKNDGLDFDKDANE